MTDFSDLAFAEKGNKDILNLLGVSFPIYEDISEQLGLGEDVKRVELHRLEDPPTGKAKDYQDKKLSGKSVIGIINTENLPVEGKEFHLFYYRFGGIPQYGFVESEALTDVEKEDPHYYFKSNGGEWRLTVLDRGN